MSNTHLPIMTNEIFELFAQTPSPHVFLDMTFGRGGHAEMLLERFPESTVTAIDRDPEAVSFAQETFAPRFPKRFEITHARFSAIDTLFPQRPTFSGILCDLGVSSPQLDKAERGFSFMHEGPLDMRMEGEGKTAAHIINHHSEKELADLFFFYGEERFSRKIAKAIVATRTKKPFTTTTQLSNTIQGLIYSKHKHPATRVFQALRIAVNKELQETEEALPKTLPLLARQGCLAVLSFHSLEDRIVKQFFRAHKKNRHQERIHFDPISPKPLSPSKEETNCNPRARSAKLRWGFLANTGV